MASAPEDGCPVVEGEEGPSRGPCTGEALASAVEDGCPVVREREGIEAKAREAEEEEGLVGGVTEDEEIGLSSWLQAGEAGASVCVDGCNVINGSPEGEGAASPPTQREALGMTGSTRGGTGLAGDTPLKDAFTRMGVTCPLLDAAAASPATPREAWRMTG